MADVFNFIGKIALGKDSEKFHPIDRREFSSGWMMTTVRFNCVSGTNRVSCMTQGGKWKDDKKNVVKTFGKSTTDTNGNVTKGTIIEIPWDKRFDEDQIAKVAGFKKFVVNTCDPNELDKLQNLVKAFENDNVTDKMMEEAGFSTLEDAKAALKKAQAKKKEFLNEWDFAEYIVKVAQSEKMKNKLFKISGNYEIQYNAEKDRFYTNYHVNRIALAAEDAEPKTEMKVDFYYGENAWDDSSLEDTGRVLVNGWLNYYDGNLKKNGFYNVDIAIRENNEKKRNALKRKFAVDDGIKQIGLTLSVIDGAERVELTVDMLSEEDRDDLELGLVDWDDLKKAYGGSVVGDKVNELRFSSLTAKKNVAQDTIYGVDDMHPAREDVVEEVEDEDVVTDIFDDDDDDL